MDTLDQCLAQANRYLNLTRNKAKRTYGFAYLAWLKGGCVSLEPERPHSLSYMGAQAIRIHLDILLDNRPTDLALIGNPAGRV